MFLTILYRVLPLVCLVPYAYAYNTTVIGQLEDDLLAGYKKTVRPASPTNLVLGFGLMHLNTLDIVTQQIDLVGFLFMQWQDPRLAFTPANYDGEMFTSLHQESVWLPPLVLNNGADGIKIVSDNSDFSSNYVTVMASGHIHYAPAANFLAQCTVSVKYYPFDYQSCSLIMTPWAFDATRVATYAIQGSIIMDLFAENGEWTITDNKLTNISRWVGSSRLSGVKITIDLQRKYSYYLLNLILPVILLAILGTFVFLLPVESGEKNGFSLTILLSMSVVMTLLSDHIPPIATQTCLLSIYLLVIFIVCMLETGATVVACRLFQYTSRGYVPSPRLQRMAVRAAKITFYRRPGESKTPTNDQDNEKSKVRSGIVKVSPVDISSKDWSDDVTENSTQSYDVADYTYEDIAVIYDKINFIFFLVLTAVFTFVFFVAISASSGPTFT